MSKTMIIERDGVKYCAHCGYEICGNRPPAASPWNYDMSAAPESLELLVLHSECDTEVADVNADEEWSCYGMRVPIAWAAINLPEVQND